MQKERFAITGWVGDHNQFLFSDFEIELKILDQMFQTEWNNQSVCGMGGFGMSYIILQVIN